MNINSLLSEIKFPNQIGGDTLGGINHAVGTGCDQALREQEFRLDNFWGRVEGLYRNYYIRQGVNDRDR